MRLGVRCRSGCDRWHLTINGVDVALATGDTAAQTVAKINGTAALQGAERSDGQPETAPAPGQPGAHVEYRRLGWRRSSSAAAIGAGNTIYAYLGIDRGQHRRHG